MTMMMIELPPINFRSVQAITAEKSTSSHATSICAWSYTYPCCGSLTMPVADAFISWQGLGEHV